LRSDPRARCGKQKSEAARGNKDEKQTGHGAQRQPPRFSGLLRGKFKTDTALDKGSPAR